MIFVDTCVWSLALRRRQQDRNPVEQRIFFLWRELFIAGDAAINGIVRQELLSGISNQQQFAYLKDRLAGVSDLAMSTSDWELGAEFFNACRSNGIAPDAVDMSICAAAHSHGIPIFTTDPDFHRYEKVLPIKLHRA